MTQKGMVLRHLIDFGSITSWEAFTEYGITRLSAIIFILRYQDGIKFDEEWVHTTNRYGNKTEFKKYILKRDDD